MSTGIVTVVEEVRAGSELATATLTTDAQLTVDDGTDFAPEGGELTIGELAGVGYASADEETGVIVLDAAIGVAFEEGEPVYVEPLTVERFAHVTAEEQEEPLLARVPHALYDRLPVGVREETPEPELVRLERDEAGELIVADVLNREPLVDGSYIAPATIPPAAVTDGMPPAISPAATVLGGIRSLFVTWVPVANHDAVTYEVHVSDESGFTPDVDTFAGEVRGTLFVIRTMPGTLDPPAYGVPHYVRLVARDDDGAASAGTEGAGSPLEVNTVDIAANAVTADRILANEALFELVRALLVEANTFRTGESPDPRLEMDNVDGFRSFGALDAVLAHFPVDGSLPSLLGSLALRATSADPGFAEQALRWLTAAGVTSHAIAGYDNGSDALGLMLRSGDVAENHAATSLAMQVFDTVRAAANLSALDDEDPNLAVGGPAQLGRALLLDSKGRSDFLRLGRGRQVHVEDDFLGDPTVPGVMRPVVSGTGAGWSAPQEAGRYGVWKGTTGSTSSGRAELAGAIGSAPFPVPVQPHGSQPGGFRLGALVKVPILSTSAQRFAVTVGLGRFTSTQRALHVRYSDDLNGGAWELAWQPDGSATFATDPLDDGGAVAVVAGAWYEIEILVGVPGSGLVWVLVNGVAKAQLAMSIPDANWPTTGWPNVGIEKRAGTTARELDVDAYWFAAERPFPTA